MIRYALAAGLSALAFSAPASAQQFTAQSDVCGLNCGNTSSSYTGPGVDGGSTGTVQDGGNDAFDFFGFVTGIGGLTFSRQTELLAGTNTYRFLDTFTNSTGSTINQAVRFSGNLGSDGNTSDKFGNSGALVTCERFDCSGGDPVVALVFSNNGFASSTLGGDIFTATYNLSVASGQSVSLLNFAFLARDLSNRSGDLALAISTAQALQAAPNVSGLSAAQQARVVNFNLTPAAVPEPSTWAMLILGFGTVGFAMRRRSVKAKASRMRLTYT